MCLMKEALKWESRHLHFLFHVLPGQFKSCLSFRVIPKPLRIKVLPNGIQNSPCRPNRRTSSNWSYLVSNKILSYFSKITDQNPKSCQNQCIHRGENFDLQVLPHLSTPCFLWLSFISTV